MKLLTSLLCAAFIVPILTEAKPVAKKQTTAKDWENRVIYQLLTDRFAKSKDDTKSCSNLSDYCGGTFQGITNHLDYISDMGFDAIWISPIPENTEGGYHGYWAKNFSAINSHFGSAADLKKLVSTAHKKNMLVMLDVVANHVGTPPTSGQYSGYTFGQKSQYHDACEIDYNNQKTVEQCWIAGLPDINTEDKKVVKELNSIVKNWVSEYGFDGIRIDTVKHIRKEFWDDYVSAAGVFATGEVFEGDASKVAPYQQHMDSLLNYPLYFPLNDVFTKTTPMSRLDSGYSEIKTSSFKNTKHLINFIDNHDNPRLLSKADKSLVKNALTYSMLVEGIPSMYYGTEQSFTGGTDPANREALWTTGYSKKTDMYKFVKSLIKVRKSSGNKVKMNIDKTDNVYVFQRGQSLIVVNNYGSGSTQSITVDAGSFSNGAHLVDVFSNTKTTVSKGKITFKLKDGQPAVFQKA